MSKSANGDSLVWFKFNPGAFMADVEGLSPLRGWIYIQLLCRYWIRQGELLEEERLSIALALTTADEKEALSSVLSMFFPDGKHKALDMLLEESARVSATARENGKRGGRRSAQASPAQAPASGPKSGPPMPPEDNPEDF